MFVSLVKLPHMHCHICSYYTPQEGCAHYGPDPLQTIANNIVSFTHNGNDKTIETGDFLAGIKHTLLYIKQKGIDISTLIN